MLPHIIIIIISFLLSVFFSGVETAYTSLTRIQQHIIIAKYPFRGKILALMLKNPMLVLSTILIGNTTANTSFSVAFSQVVVTLIGSNVLAIATGIITLFLLIFCEITPKQFSLQFNEKIIIKAIFPLYIFQCIFLPFSLVLNKISILVQFIMKKNTQKNNDLLTRAHLAHLFYNAQSLGELESEYTNTIMRILNFSKLSIESIMVHRRLVVSLSSQSTIEEAQNITNKYIYSTYPVYEQDNQEHIIGIVHLHDIIKEKNTQKTIKQLIQKAIFITKSTTVHEVIEQIKYKEHTLSVVIDEFGGFSGIASIKDITRYIFDLDAQHHNKEHTEKLFLMLDSRRALLDTSVPLNELEEYIRNILEPSPESNTIGGYILELTQNIPTVGNSIDTPLGTFKILRVKQNRIQSLLWILPHSSKR